MYAKYKWYSNVSVYVAIGKVFCIAFFNMFELIVSWNSTFHQTITVGFQDVFQIFFVQSSLGSKQIGFQREKDAPK